MRPPMYRPLLRRDTNDGGGGQFGHEGGGGQFGHDGGGGQFGHGHLRAEAGGRDVAVPNMYRSFGVNQQPIVRHGNQGRPDQPMMRQDSQGRPDQPMVRHGNQGGSHQPMMRQDSQGRPDQPMVRHGNQGGPDLNNQMMRPGGPDANSRPIVRQDRNDYNSRPIVRQDRNDYNSQPMLRQGNQGGPDLNNQPMLRQENRRVEPVIRPAGYLGRTETLALKAKIGSLTTEERSFPFGKFSNGKPRKAIFVNVKKKDGNSGVGHGDESGVLEASPILDFKSYRLPMPSKMVPLSDGVSPTRRALNNVHLGHDSDVMIRIRKSDGDLLGTCSRALSNRPSLDEGEIRAMTLDREGDKGEGAASETGSSPPPMNDCGGPPTFMTLTKKKAGSDLKINSKELLETHVIELRTRGDMKSLFECSKLMISHPDLSTEEGYVILRRLAAQGYLESLYYIGQAYFDDERFGDAYSQFHGAAKKGYPPAMHSVGECAEKGKGCKKNMKLALQMYTKSATTGNRDSMYRMAMAELNGELGLVKDIGRAVKWLKRGATGNLGVDFSCG